MTHLLRYSRFVSKRLFLPSLLICISVICCCVNLAYGT